MSLTLAHLVAGVAVGALAVSGAVALTPAHAESPDQRETTFMTMEEASRTVFADSFALMSVQNKQYVLDNLKGVWILPLNDTDHPYRHKGRAYVNDYCGHTLYIGWEQLVPELTEDNAEMLGHEAAHGACHQHGDILWRVEASIRVDIWEAKNGPLVHVTRQHAIDFIMTQRHGHK